MVYLTRRTTFSAAHRLWSSSLSEEENIAIYDKCANPNGHGHNYVLEVSVEGEPHPVTGMVLDLKELKDLLKREVVDLYDHRFLNYEVPPFDRVNPTAENIAREIWRRLEPSLSSNGNKLRQVRLYETPDLWVDYAGEEACSA